MEATYNYQDTGFFKKFILFLLLVCIALAVTYSTHAVLKHGSDAWDVRNCINKNGALEIWTNPATGRDALICQLGKGLFGIQILKGNEEKTAFVKEKLKRLEQVRNYLSNTGYIPK